MSNQNFTKTFLFDKSPKEVFEAINNVRGWWSATLEGESEKLNDEFTYRHKDLHDSKQKLIELIPDKKIVWLVTDSLLSFTKKKDEWTGTRVSFEISRENDKTILLFTHQGLTPEIECFDACSNGWSYYLENSLLPLIKAGHGQPDK